MNHYKTEAGRRAVMERYAALLREWPVAHEQVRVKTRHGETFLVASGPREAPSLLLLHGSSSNIALWRSDVAACSAEFRTYAVDMIGEPGLSAPVRPVFGAGAYADWLEDVMTGLGVTRAAIVGVSLGGWVALEFATRSPQRVSALALLCPSGIGRQRWEFMLRALPLLLCGDWGRRRLFAQVAGAGAAAIPDDTGLAELSTLIFKHFRPRQGKLPVFDDAALRRLAMPVMLTVGARDVMLDSAETRRRIEGCVPHARVRYLPEAGHILLAQMAPVLAFLRDAELRD